MIYKFKMLLESWRDYRKLRNLTNNKIFLVFYSEGKSYWRYFQPIIEELSEHYTINFIWLTSDPRDPMLTEKIARGKAFFIGDGIVRTLVFQSLRASVVVTTMPDLNNFYIKRSPSVGHYMYLHHSMVSSHTVYNKGAFDHFDSILCVGPHHVDETRAWEVLNDLPKKQLFEHGYAVLDLLLAGFGSPSKSPANSKDLHVILAPSWGPNGLLESRGPEVISILLDAGLYVTVRPHPVTRQRFPKAIKDIMRFNDHPQFLMDENISSLDPLYQAQVMISDWSGVALEFAFGLEKPVVFIDMAQKINNLDYDQIGCVPLEASIREQIGSVLSPEKLKELPDIIKSLASSPAEFRVKINRLRNEFVFNVGDSGRQGAKIISELHNEQKNSNV